MTEGGSRPEEWRPRRRITAIVSHGAAARASALGTSWGSGVRVVAIDTFAPGTDLSALRPVIPSDEADASGPERLVVVGDGDSWLRHGTLLRQVRSDGELLVAAECAGDLRALTGERALPPYALPRAHRAWLISHASVPRRVILPA